MMKQIVYFFIAMVATLLLCTGCEKVVEFEIEDTERDVVVNGLPCTDSMLFVNLTYTRFFLDNREFLPVTNADVSVDVNGVLHTFSSREGANYLFNYYCTEGDTLTVHVNIEGRNEIVGGTRVPALPAIDSLSMILDTTMPFLNSGEVSFVLNDNAMQSNYYYIYITERDSGSRWNEWYHKFDTIDTVYNAYINCMDLSITSSSVNSSEGILGYFNTLLFTDSLINGEEHKISMSIIIPKDTAEHPLQRDYTLVIESLSREAFLYRRAILQATSMSQSFAEPAEIYTNLGRGNLGIFAAIAKRVYPVTFIYKEPEE